MLLKKWGVLDEDNNVILKPKYQNIDFLPFIDEKGRPSFKVQIEDYWGIVDLEGKNIIPPKYNNILFNNGYFIVRKGRNKFKLQEEEEFLEKIEYDYSCGYVDNQSLLSFDSNLSDLFTIYEK